MSTLEPTREQIHFYQATHATKWHTPQYSTARYGIERGLGVSLGKNTSRGEIAEFCDDWEEVVRWGCRILAYLSEDRVETPRRRSTGIPNSWEEAARDIRAVFQEIWGKDLAEAQETLEDDPEYFAQHGHGTVVDGKVTDPWDARESKPCYWLLENMTPFHLWCVFQRVQDAVEDCVLDNLGDWAEGGTEGKPPEVAHEAFTQSLQGLYKYLQKELNLG